MSVKELVLILQGMPQDAPVVVNMHASELANGMEAISVHQERATHSKRNQTWRCANWYWDQEFDIQPQVIVNVSSVKKEIKKWDRAAIAKK